MQNKESTGYMNILSLKEEEKLSSKERRIYYQKLRTHLLSTKHTHLSKGSLTVCPKIHPFIQSLLKEACGYDIEADGENVNGLDAIYANTHQDKYDHINFVVSNPNHTILLNSTQLSPVYKMMLNLNGAIYVDKKSKKDKSIAKLEMMRLLLNNKSITIFPESAWLLSPNKLYLEPYIGIVDMARKTGLPIVPVVHDYIYINKNDGKEHIESARIKYGSPIYVNEMDSIFAKLDEVKDAFSTMRWDMMEGKGIYNRESVVNDYINFIIASSKNLKKSGTNIETEEKGLFGIDDPFYQDHYINAADFDENGVILPPNSQRRIVL